MAAIDRRFGRQAFGLNPAAYHAARPDYPDWVYDMLAARCGLKPGARLAPSRRLMGGHLDRLG